MPSANYPSPPAGCLCRGSPDTSLDESDLNSQLVAYLERLGPRQRVLVVPPDGSRAHARAGILLKAAYDFYGPALKAVLPALGTHRPMDAVELERHFPGIPQHLFREHRWKEDLVTLGRVPSAYVREISGGHCDFEWPVQVNRLLTEGDFDLILSLGQVVPHEVVGMANYSKNIFVGTGGRDSIALSHWLGAAWGIERTLGRLDTPVRALLDYAQNHFAGGLPLVYALTVVGPVNPVDSPDNTVSGGVAGAGAGHDARHGDVVRGLFIGSGRTVFEQAAALSAAVNISHTGRPVQTMVVWLDAAEFRSTWLGNKAIYRSRLAMADGGRLIILAPGVDCFGEDAGIDRIIRQYGYCGSAKVLSLVAGGDLSRHLAAAAHLMHGSSEGRFDICLAAGGLDRAAVEAAGFQWAEWQTLAAHYQIEGCSAGWNKRQGEEFFFIKNPALGLWMV
ncbi:MAG: hypothetical protein A2087_10145 [Spirochaetes bacterium GWD1_61_31]|nr:MAG: hypothetical protein A2Y37_01965 [Spirochaetes bacterium GWB1_60_80]OHD32042.1 MAG: hypothetical protein A2004_06365 [Spirochaetes bacterium GWC1_61_12]OHD40645.1 MAG: hypothetical protein A2087_10145 [Spirochaetes bacterium GWD1_61_31]OHD43916.1 MAG: hypothetical protein A2Y35_12495 [Spirochaetes bacterium GWE1_60_18]OHD59788.1 MAG: hypothetical protein A2Y32_02350 [Spirochaetes bacterium GWF1_60_12]HAP43491.1 D-mannonate epimerase [Spirochaetaceae bacterium]